MTVKFGGKREEEVKDVALTTPLGTEIVVSAKRAEALLQRAPLQGSDGKKRSYTRGHKPVEDTEKKPSGGRAERQ